MISSSSSLKKNPLNLHVYPSFLATCITENVLNVNRLSDFQEYVHLYEIDINSVIFQLYSLIIKLVLWPCISVLRGLYQEVKIVCVLTMY